MLVTIIKKCLNFYQILTINCGKKIKVNAIDFLENVFVKIQYKFICAIVLKFWTFFINVAVKVYTLIINFKIACSYLFEEIMKACNAASMGLV